MSTKRSLFDRIQWDWSMNVGNLITLVAFILAGIGAWYDVKSDVRVHSVEIQAIKKVQEAQEVRDKAQDDNREIVVRELKALIREENRDVKQEIRDWRNDLMRYRSIPR